jgi:hypothetical protein
VPRFAKFVRTPFSFLFVRSQKEELIAEYIVREHHRGRALDDILEDPYITNRCTPEQIRRVFERPELIHALGNDVVEQHLSKL